MENCKGPWLSKMILKNNKVGGLTVLSNFKLTQKHEVTKTLWYKHKGIKSIQLGKNILFNKLCWGNLISTFKQKHYKVAHVYLCNLHFLHMYPRRWSIIKKFVKVIPLSRNTQKINSKWTSNLNIGAKTIKFYKKTYG